MSDYQYAYPNDLSWMDQEFGKDTPLRELAEQVWRVNAWLGNDLYDVVEDWPNIDCPNSTWEEVTGASLNAISEADRMRLHIGFGGAADEVLALRAKDHRYTLRRNS